MTTLTQITDRAEIAIADATNQTWDSTLVKGWIKDAIRDYSQLLPRTKQSSLSLLSGNTEHLLPADFRAMISMEYPDNQTPPVYLYRLDRRHPDFSYRDNPRAYDVTIKNDGSTDLEAKLWLSGAAIINDESTPIVYLADHDWELDDSDSLTVPGRDEPVLILYVVWQAWKYIASFEVREPDPTTLLLSQLASNADRAERAYRRALNQAVAGRNETTGGYIAAPWKADIYDPIY